MYSFDILVYQIKILESLIIFIIIIIFANIKTKAK